MSAMQNIENNVDKIVGLDVIDVLTPENNLKQQNFILQIFIGTKEFFFGQKENDNLSLNKVEPSFCLLQNGFDKEVENNQVLQKIVRKLCENPNYLQDTLKITNNNQLKNIIDRLIENPNYLEEIADIN